MPSTAKSIAPTANVVVKTNVSRRLATEAATTSLTVRNRNILKARDYVFLSSIELDAEAGRFPELMVQYLRDEVWADTQSFFVAPIKRTGRGSEYAVGRLTFEAAPGQTVRVLAQNGGFRWGAGLRVWGLQASEARIADAIEMSPHDAAQVRRAEVVAELRGLRTSTSIPWLYGFRPKWTKTHEPSWAS